jgi:hypothetical protein
MDRQDNWPCVVCADPITKRIHSISAQSEPDVSRIFMKFQVLVIKVLPLLCIGWVT